MRFAALAIALLSACLPERAHVWLDVYADPDPVYIAGARAWEELGFTVELESAGLPDCLAERDAGCEIRISVARPPDLIETRGSDALSVVGLRQIAIDARVTDPGKLRVRVAHEVGHIILATGEHPELTRRGELSIMAGNWSLVTELDRDFACRVAELC